MCLYVLFFFQAEDGIRDLVRSRGLGDVYKRQSEWRWRMGRSYDDIMADRMARMGPEADAQREVLELSLIHI